MTLDAFPSLPPAPLRRRSVGNLLSMGHCAPAIMQTFLDASGSDARWLVLLTAGLPGGIGNTGGECGGVMAPLILVGLRHPRDETRDGLPVAVDLGWDLLARFTAAQHTVQCREIRGRARLPLRCIGVVSQAPQHCADCLQATVPLPIAPERRAAFARLYAHWVDRRFHCADEVMAHVRLPAAVPADEVRDGTTALMGGTVFSGGTCGALTAGVMSLGLALGEVERSRPRVARMIAIMAMGGDAFADDRNAFNPIMNLGHELAQWFEGCFGSTQCTVLTGCDLATDEGVSAYIETGRTSTCQQMARAVAARASEIIAHASPEDGGP